MWAQPMSSICCETIVLWNINVCHVAVSWYFNPHLRWNKKQVHYSFLVSVLYIAEALFLFDLILSFSIFSISF